MDPPSLILAQQALIGKATADRLRMGDRAGRACLSETAGSPANHRPVWPNAFASSNGSRPNRVQLRQRSDAQIAPQPTAGFEIG